MLHDLDQIAWHDPDPLSKAYLARAGQLFSQTAYVLEAAT
jgi:hypothetical protein